MFDRWTRVVLMCILLIAVPITVSAAEYDVTTDKTIDIVDQTQGFEENTYEITAVTQVDPQDEITVEYDAPSNETPVINIVDGDRRIIYAYQDDSSGPGEFSIDVGKSIGSESGTYAIVVGDYAAVHPLVIRGYSVSVDAPQSITHGQSVTVDGEFSQLNNKAYDQISVVVASASSSENVTGKAKVDGKTFSASVPTDELSTGSYDVYAVVRGDDSVLGRQKEILGLSSPELLKIKSSESNKADQTGSGDSTNGGGPAPVETTEEADSQDPPTQVSLADGPVTRSVTDTDPDAGGVNVVVNAGPVGQVSFDVPSDAATGEMTVSQSSSVTNSFSSQFSTNQVKTAVSITVPPRLANASATVQFQLSDEDLGDTSIDNLQVVKNTGGGSQVLSSSTRTENGSVVITARTPGFSEFAVIEAPPDAQPAIEKGESTAEAEVSGNSSEISSGDTSEDATNGSTETSTPGFGLTITFVSLLISILIIREFHV